MKHYTQRSLNWKSVLGRSISHFEEHTTNLLLLRKGVNQEQEEQRNKDFEITAHRSHLVVFHSKLAGQHLEQSPSLQSVAVVADGVWVQRTTVTGHSHPAAGLIGCPPQFGSAQSVHKTEMYTGWISEILSSAATASATEIHQHVLSLRRT